MVFVGSTADMYQVLAGTTVDIGGGSQNLLPTGSRVYLNEGQNFPGDIPAFPGVPAPAAQICVSIRPFLPELLAGNMDTELIAFLNGAPRAPFQTTLLALWHEASSGGPNGAYNPYFSTLGTTSQVQALLKQAQSYVRGKAQKYNPNVLVGAIEAIETKDVGSITRNQIPYMAEGLDFYACDTYDFGQGDAVPGLILSGFQTACNNLNASLNYTPPIAVTETNSVFPGRRPYWFTAVWSWLVANTDLSDATCFLSFWRADGAESGAWLPDDWATIDALYAIFMEAAEVIRPGGIAL